MGRLATALKHGHGMAILPSLADRGLSALWPGSLSETLIVNQSRRFSNLLREEEEA